MVFMMDLDIKNKATLLILDRVIKDKLATSVEMLHYSMTQLVSVVITGIDHMEILKQALEAARTYKLLGQTQIASLLERTRAIALDGSTELFKTSSHFDCTAQNSQWLG